MLESGDDKKWSTSEKFIDDIINCPVMISVEHITCATYLDFKQIDFHTVVY